jgi:transketolase
MRNAFIKSLSELAEADDRIWLLTGDLGYTVLEDFAEQFPERFVNAGVAEQNMMGVAAGLALAGKIPFVYSIANFPIMRCMEQIRNDVCYHNLSVKIVTVGSGLTYAAYGYTHLGVEDLSAMRALPNMKIVSPGDPIEADAATRALASEPGPGFLRLGRAGEAVVHQGSLNFKLGKAITLREGDDCTIISTGSVLTVAADAAKILADKGIHARVLSMPSIVPLDVDAVHAALKTGIIVSIEEHGIGGLGSAISEVLAGKAVHFVPMRMPSDAPRHAGNQSTLRARFGLTAEKLVEAVLSGSIASQEAS